MDKRRGSSDAAGKRRFPKELADELLVALAAVRGLDHDLLFRYLVIVRSGSKQPARTSAHSSRRSLPPHPTEICEVPPEWIERIVRLDAAFARLHRYKVFPEDWLAEGVNRASQRQRASRSREAEPGGVIEHAMSLLRKYRYHSAKRGEKGTIRERVMYEAGASKSSVDKAIVKVKKQKNVT